MLCCLASAKDAHKQGPAYGCCSPCRPQTCTGGMSCRWDGWHAASAWAGPAVQLQRWGRRSQCVLACAPSWQVFACSWTANTLPPYTHFQAQAPNKLQRSPGWQCCCCLWFAAADACVRACTLAPGLAWGFHLEGVSQVGCGATDADAPTHGLWVSIHAQPLHCGRCEAPHQVPALCEAAGAGAGAYVV